MCAVTQVARRWISGGSLFQEMAGRVLDAHRPSRAQFKAQPGTVVLPIEFTSLRSRHSMLNQEIYTSAQNRSFPIQGKRLHA